MPNPALVSLVVRSMGRPCLADALASVVGQDYRPLELIVVDATGGSHPALSTLAGLDAVRLIDLGRPLNRPQAANAGLEAARGEWMGFLDDDDILEPTHVTRLVERGSAADRPTLVYAQHWALDRLHRVVHRRHNAFNPLIMHYYCQVFGMSCIVHRSLRDAGHRLDDTLTTSEDWDFWLRLMPHARFATVREPTHFYFLEAGTSGTGIGLNRHGRANHAHNHATVKARHATARTVAWDAYFARLSTGMALHRQGRRDAARRHYEALLGEFPDEPNARYLLGRVAADDGDLHNACHLYRQAIHFNGDAADYHLALGDACASLGHCDESVDAYATAVRHAPALAPTVSERLRAAIPGRPPPALLATEVSSVPRNAACPCGSGLRFKACHGKAGTTVPMFAEPRNEGAHAEALALARAGDVVEACERYRTIAAAFATDVDALHALALLEWDRDNMEEAFACLTRAVALRPGDAQLVDDLGRLRAARLERASRCRMAAQLEALPFVARRDHPQARMPRGTPVHLVASSDAGSDIAHADAMRQALGRILGRHGPVTSWARAQGGGAPANRGASSRELDPESNAMPVDGVIVFVGSRHPAPAWLARGRAGRIVVVADSDDPGALLDLVTAVHETTGQDVHLVLPAMALRTRAGLPGTVCAIPPAAPPCRKSRSARLARPFTVGRVAVNDHREFHPRDPALIRDFLSAGDHVRVLGGSVLMRHFPPDRTPPALALLATDAETTGAFLDSLDCVFQRSGPAPVDVSARPVASAMTAGVPVVCAMQDDEAALVTHGVDGFLFDADDNGAGLACMALLRNDPALRACIGAAARARAALRHGPLADAAVCDAVLGHAPPVRAERAEHAAYPAEAPAVPFPVGAGPP